MADQTFIEIEIAYAEPERQWLKKITIPTHTTIETALEWAALKCDDLKIPPNAAYGIFGNLQSQDTILRSGDRLEIYRPLKKDPKERRWDTLKTKHKTNQLNKS